MVITTKRKIAKIFLMFFLFVIVLNFFYYDYQICRDAQSSSSSIFCLVLSTYVKTRNQGLVILNLVNVTGVVENVRRPAKDYLKTHELGLILKKEVLNESLETTAKISTVRDTRQATNLATTTTSTATSTTTTTTTPTITPPTTTTPTTTPPTTTTTRPTTTTAAEPTTTTTATTTTTTTATTTTTTTQAKTEATPDKQAPGNTSIHSPTVSGNTDSKTQTMSTTPTTTITNETLKCHIPKLDPFHREVTPYITWSYINDTCKIKQTKSRVENGQLIVNLENVVEVNLNYIKRVDDNINKLETHLIYNKAISNKTKDLAYNLEDDFIRVDIKEVNRTLSEYHMYPVRKPNPEGPKFRKYDAGKSQFNVMIIMLDSVSHASAQRYIPKTYKFLQNNPYTTIMEGHTIVGDATTPQLCATFFGDQPENLKPEGRRGYRGAENIDKWPSLLKDFTKNGYATLHSEDEPYINTFNFRLLGFQKQPTLKYLRTYWRESNDLRKIKYYRSNSCPITYAMDYFKNFYQEYADELRAVILSNSALTHNAPERAQMFDGGFIKFFQQLNETKQLESTVVVLFGDHGMREGGFRSTIQGKLEERLPLMTITLPPVFYERHPELAKNLKRNSKVLTTPYDIHTTLKHLINFTSGEIPKHKFGRSLFTDIASLNRECSEAGVPPFWCVCKKYVAMKDLRDPIVRDIANAITQSINEIVSKNEAAKSQCQTLSLDQVHRASKMIRAAKDDGAFQTYELLLKLKPCSGLFEATAEYDSKTKKVKVGTNFSRVNLYGDQPKCIQKQFPYLRKFCCCNENQ